MKLKTALTVAGLAIAMASAANLQAQDNPQGKGQGRGNRGGPGGGDPGDFQKRILQGVRDRLEIKDDAEWKVTEPLVQKVMDARREVQGGGMRAMMGGRGGGGGNNGGGNGDNNGGGNRFRGFGGEPSAEEEALRKASESNASKDELKSKMAAFRKVKQANEAKLKAAQDALKKVLSLQQEAIALRLELVQ